MKFTSVRVRALVVFALMATIAVGQKLASTSHPHPGGRPGRFMFATDEEIKADWTQRAQAREKLTAMRAQIDKLAKNKAAKQQLLSNIEFMENVLKKFEERETHTSSATSDIVVKVLNEKKGTSNCEFCHTDERMSQAEPSRKGK
jgi:hypothetical protein